MDLNLARIASAPVGRELTDFPRRVDALASLPTPPEVELDAPRDVLHTPSRTFKSAEILDELELPAAVVDAEENLRFMNDELRGWRTMKPELAALIFGSEQRWKDALGRLGYQIGKQMNVVQAARTAAGIADLVPGSCSRPLAPGGGVAWAGD